jgi:hypothetical protein
MGLYIGPAAGPEHAGTLATIVRGDLGRRLRFEVRLEIAAG